MVLSGMLTTTVFAKLGHYEFFYDADCMPHDIVSMLKY